jgi:large subunit ribosomal protein L18
MRRNKILPLKRRLEEKTNYRRRLALVKSGIPRVVVRISNSNVTLQLVEYIPPGTGVSSDASNGSDKAKFAFISKQLEGLGWKHSKNNTSACYLSGLVFGHICQKNKVESAIFDLGLAKTTAGNRYFAVLKGLADSGLNIPYSEDKMPSDDRIAGKHTTKETQASFVKVKQKILDDYAK